MKKTKVLVLRTAGTNCDKETAHAFMAQGADVTLLHINHLLTQKTLLLRHHILAIPGGFTYGDDIASGRVFANEIRLALGKTLSTFIKNGSLVIGICNGFQILVKMGLLPGIHTQEKFTQEASLITNERPKFVDKWVWLKTCESVCVWTKGITGVLHFPVAHAEGRFVVKESIVFDTMKSQGQIVLRYSDERGARKGYPYNPNGSFDDIAGICDPTGRIFGLMPHPERHMHFLQHPRWKFLSCANAVRTTPDGARIFKNGIDYVKRYL
jgi:phosphoribosylformylglycinamidine synthase